MSKEKTTTTGISFLGMLTILFIALKLTGSIDWAWWLVLSPITFPLMATGILFVSIGGIALIVSETAWYKRESKKREEAPSKPSKKSKFQTRLDQMAEKRQSKLN